MGKNSSNKPRDPNVCWCNMVPKSAIEKAIRNGKTDIYEIFEVTNAGVGACGGSCRPYIQKMIDQYLKDGTFPEKPR
ncbi:MAG: (2Fe-2S)-binding protein [Pseudomonadota bacterium]